MSQEKILSTELDNPPLSVPDSLANLTVLRENVKRLVTTVISRENLKNSFAKLNPDGSLVRMSRGYAQANLEGFLENSYMIFPRWGIVSDGVAGKLPILELPTTGNGSSLLPTVTTQEVEHPEMFISDTGRRIKENWKGSYSIGLADRIAMLPTPTSRDYKDTGTMKNVPVNALLGRELGKNHGMKLQPAFAEWMMGFPPEWTVLSASEMPLSRSKSTRSSKRLQTLKEG